MKTYNILAMWDDEVSVWVATSEDIPGLVTEAPTLDQLSQKLREMVPELLELNNDLPQNKSEGFFSLLTEQRMPLRFA